MNAADFLWGLGRISMQAGVVVLLVLLVQWLFRRHLSPRWRCALWLLVLVRLTLPVSINSMASIFNLWPHPAAGVATGSRLATETMPTSASDPQQPVDLTEAKVEAPRSGEATREAESPSVGSEVRRPGVRAVRQVQPVSLPQAPVTNFAARISWTAIALAGWSAGLLGLTVLVTLSSFRLRSRLVKATPVTHPASLELLLACAQQMKLARPGSHILMECPGIESPALHGIFRPRLLLPAGFAAEFPRDDLRFVLLHELAHLKRRDLLVNWVATVIQIVHWFNPLVWLAFARWRADREAACDALVLEAAGDGQNKEYGRAILHLLERFVAQTGRPGLVGIMENQRYLRQRIGMIATYRPAQRWEVVPFSLIVGLGLVCLTDAEAPQEGADGALTPQIMQSSTAAPPSARETRRGTDPPLMRNGTNLPICVVNVSVKDKATSQPISDAEVSVTVNYVHPPQPRRLTDSNGQYVLKLPVPARRSKVYDPLDRGVFYTVNIAHPNFASSSSASIGFFEGNSVTDLIFPLETGVAIGGQVRDERGRPSAGVRVLLYGSGPLWTGQVDYKRFNCPRLDRRDAQNPAATTDQNGWWSFARCPSILEFLNVILVRPDGSRAVFLSWVQSPSYGARPQYTFSDLRRQTAVLTLEDGVTVRGRVVDERGRPLGGVRVKESYGTNPLEHYSEFVTGANGRFERPHQPLRQLIYTASAPGRAMVSTVIAVRPKMAEVRLVMLPTRPLHFMAMDGQGNPLSEVTLRMDSADNPGQILTWEGQTDTQGLAVWTEAPLAPIKFTAARDAYAVKMPFRRKLDEFEKRLVLYPDHQQRTTLRIKTRDAQTGAPVIVRTVSIAFYENPAMGYSRAVVDPYQELSNPMTNEFTVEIPVKNTQWINEACDLKIDAQGYRPLVSPFKITCESEQTLDLALVTGTPLYTVLTPNGQAADRAVVWVNPGHGDERKFYAPDKGLNGRWLKVVADSQGRFIFPPVAGDRPLVISHGQGLRATTTAAIERNGGARLHPWGRIEGRLLIGNQSEGGMTICLSNYETDPAASVDYRAQQITSSGDGRFTFESVPPGEYLLVRRYRSDPSAVASSHPRPITVSPGETVRLVYGGDGHRVTGRARTVPPRGDIDWLHDRQFLTLRQPSLPLVNQDDFVDTRQYQEQWEETRSSQPYLQNVRERRTYEVLFEPDGRFHIDDVPEGRYELRLRFTEPDRASDLPDFSRLEMGSMVRDVVVPPGQEPFDLGDIDVPVATRAL